MQNNSHLAVLIQEQAKIYGDREVLIYKDFANYQSPSNVHQPSLMPEAAVPGASAPGVPARANGSGWKSCSWNQFSDMVKRVSNAMLNFGVKIQENVGIFSQNSVQYLFCDFGAWGIRAVTIPFYATSSEQQVQFMVTDAKIRILFVGEQEQYDKARRVQAICHTLERIIVFDRGVRLAKEDTTSMYFDDFMQLGEGLPRQSEVEALQAQASMDDIANILYTSGTTGDSKGVILTSGQYHAAFEANHKCVPVNENDRVLNFLPFTHIFEKAWKILCLTEGARLIVNTYPQQVQQSMKETHPTCMSSVPRFWEKVYQGVQAKIDGSSAMQRKIFQHAINVGKRHNIDYLSKGRKPPVALHLEYEMLNRTIFSLVRKELGLENAHFFPTAGAAVNPVIEEFVHSIGITMDVGYGLTESLATVSCNHIGEPWTVGSVGIPIEGLSIKISDEGEVLLKGPTITRGYYNRDDLTKAAFTDDGYFRTGDSGYLKDGELFLKERIKDLFKTSNGKYIAPQMIESKILVDKYVDQIAIIADQRKFVSALIIPVYPLLEEYAREHGIAFDGREDLCRNEQIHTMMQERIDTLQQQLAHYEQIKRFTLLPHGFSMERGELTNTLKIKRRVLNENYRKEIDMMYEE